MAGTPEKPKRKRGRPKGAKDGKPRKPANSARFARDDDDGEAPRQPGKFEREFAQPKKGDRDKPPPPNPIKDTLDALAPHPLEWSDVRRGKSALMLRIKRRAFLRILALGFSRTRASRECGIDPSTVRKLCRRHAVWKSAVEDYERRGHDELEDVLTEMVHGARSAASFLPTISSLKARKPDKYRDNARIDLTARHEVKPGEGFRELLDSFAMSVRAALAAQAEQQMNRAALMLPPVINGTVLPIGAEKFRPSPEMIAPPKPAVIDHGPPPEAVIADQLGCQPKSDFDHLAEPPTSDAADHRFSRGEFLR